MKYTFDLDITQNMYEHIEKSFAYYGLTVNDVVNIMLKKSYILGDCPFNPDMDSLEQMHKNMGQERQLALNSDIDWGNPEEVARYMEKDEEA